MDEYVTVRRLYRNRETKIVSPLLYEAVGNKVTLRPDFRLERTHWWKGSPFEEIEDLPASYTIPDWWVGLKSVDNDDVSVLFDAICDVMERVWKPDKFHVVFHSSGWDSRILSAAVKRLTEKNGQDWLGNGLLFLANRWEAGNTWRIMKSEGWPVGSYAIYNDGLDDNHFLPWLDFDDFWRTCPAPVSLPGNLWWYLPDWAQTGLIPSDDGCQAFSGYWANETWKQWASGGPAGWLKIYPRHYQHVMATFRFKLPMEFPLSHPDVLRLVSPKFKMDGDNLRRAVANYACPEARHIKNQKLHDRKHLVSKRLRDYCQVEYERSWYARHVQRDWKAPVDSELCDEWLRWSVASLCEELVRRGVELNVTD